MLTALIAALLTTSSPRPAISFWTNAGLGVAQVWLINADGSRKTNLSRNSFDDWATDWR
jgi:hypothetical protein